MKSIADRLRALEPKLRDDYYRLSAIDDLKALADEVERLERALQIVVRELRCYGSGWRADWSHFDGRTLRDQLDSLAIWAVEYAAGERDDEYTDGSKFCEAQWLRGAVVWVRHTSV